MELIALLAVLAYLAATTPAVNPLTVRAVCWLVVLVLCAVQVWRNWR